MGGVTQIGKAPGRRERRGRGSSQMGGIREKNTEAWWLTKKSESVGKGR